MTCYIQKLTGLFVIGLVVVTIFSTPAYAQDNDFEGWLWYAAYTRMNPAIEFEAWIFTMESMREAFGLSYIIGYMNGVNNNDFYSYFYRDKIKEKWYQKGLMDGYFDRFLYQSGQCITLHVLFSYYFGFYDYMMPYRAVRGWLEAISYPNFFAPIVCVPNMPSPLYVFEYHKVREVVYSDNPAERPTRSPNDYRNIEEHKNISLRRVKEIPEYEPTDKPTRSKNDDRNTGEHTTISTTSLTRGIDLRPRLNRVTRNNSRTNNSVLRRVYEDWPELKKYVEGNGLDNIRVLDRRRKKKSNLNMENATIEIALPGGQFSRDFRRKVGKRFNINLSEFESIRRHGNINSRQFGENWGRTNIRTNTRNGTGTGGQRIGISSSSSGERIERNLK